MWDGRGCARNILTDESPSKLWILLQCGIFMRALWMQEAMKSPLGVKTRPRPGTLPKHLNSYLSKWTGNGVYAAILTTYTTSWS